MYLFSISWDSIFIIYIISINVYTQPFIKIERKKGRDCYDWKQRYFIAPFYLQLCRRGSERSMPIKISKNFPSCTIMIVCITVGTEIPEKTWPMIMAVVEYSILRNVLIALEKKVHEHPPAMLRGYWILSSKFLHYQTLLLPVVSFCPVLILIQVALATLEFFQFPEHTTLSCLWEFIPLVWVIFLPYLEEYALKQN